MPQNNNSIVIFWFRRDLRLHDNVGFFKALSSGKPVLPLFIFDTEILEKLPHKNDARVSFIYKSILKINSELQKQNSGALIKIGEPKDIFIELLKQYSVSHVFANEDYEPYSTQRDKEILELLQQKNSGLTLCKDHLIFKPGEVLKPDNLPYTVFTPFSKKWKEHVKNSPISFYKSEELLQNCYKSNTFEIPSLAMLGFIESQVDIHVPKISKEQLEKYSSQRDIPFFNATTHLGVHLRFGTVSIREIVIKALNCSETFLNELIWREFFSHILYFYPFVINKAFKKKFNDFEYEQNEENFNKWCKGKTGYPIVDAGMRELNKTGFMHNRVRMVTASFLCKHLLIDWRWGEAYFAEKLLDYELASNNGNWQWAASTGCDAVPYFRIFNPISQQEKFDPHFEYIKQWVPEFNTKEYPKQIVEHNFARNRYLERCKKLISL